MITHLKDRNGIMIKAGDIVRDNEGFIGKVLFINGAWRYDVQEGRLLKFNSSLLFKEGSGTCHLEIVAQPSPDCIQQETVIPSMVGDNIEVTYPQNQV